MQDNLLYFKELLDSDAERLFEIYSNAEAMKHRKNPPMKKINDAYIMFEHAKEKAATGYEIRFT